MTSLPAIAILGAGSMGGAILDGLLSPDVTVSGGIRVTNRTKAKADALIADGVTSLCTELDPEANREAVRGARIVLVGVKPAMVAALLEEIESALEPDAIVVSVAAGVTIAAMEAKVPCTVIRSMPNTPSKVGLGVTGVCAGSRADSDELDLVVALFETVGSVLVVPEEKINAVSAISGSGPAYVFYLIEQLTETAVGLGFDRADAERMVAQTFRGASELLAGADVGPAELRRRVTSPKGTTERAIEILQDADLAGLFDRATAAAVARAEEIAAGG